MFSHGCEGDAAPVALHGSKGIFSFAKENIPFGTPRERLDIAGEQLEELQCLPIAPLACGKAAFTPAIRLGVLLSSAAALPISRWYSLISVYRSTHQCGERSNAAFGTQSAAEGTSHAPHDSKARLQNGDETHGFMAKPCTPHLHCAARAVIRAINCQCAGSRGKAPCVLLGVKGGHSLT